ncbi:hypothetical protein PTW37_10265 [Arthrobacter agilis]|uniref:hypothetical protein n=1 Tax=Arthrobacter agilis TaxID=37921 RepID=UPI002366D6E3|nr:hypothetical protein [Arthrobacter agilis]WDF32258.1 hypothetical protein PTW37_10265 [Arthrobacter agilis]
MHRLKPYGPRGVAMLALAVLAFGRAVAYTQPASPTFTPAILLELQHIIPTITYGVLWFGTGVIVTIGAYRKQQIPALAVMAGMSTLWAIVYVWAAVTRTIDAGAQASVGSWITATVYMAIVIVIGALAAMINKLERVDADE